MTTKLNHTRRHVRATGAIALIALSASAQAQTLNYGSRQSAVVPSTIGKPSGPSYPAQQDWRGAYYVAPVPVKPSAPGSAMTGGGTTNNSYPYGVVQQEYRVGPQQNALTAAGTYVRNNPQQVVSAATLFIPQVAGERLVAGAAITTTERLSAYVSSRAAMTTAPKVIAGAEARTTVVKAADRLAAQYGGAPANYVKVTGPNVPVTGGGMQAHAFQNSVTTQFFEAKPVLQFKKP